jgi:transcriptional regulator with XRE-family HTH domain
MSKESVEELRQPDTIDSAEVCRAVGARARELRLDLGLTMAKFAEQAGLSLGMLSKIEHGQTAPSLSTLVRLASAAGVPVTALFRGLDEEHDIVIVRKDEGHEILHQGSSANRIYQDLGTLRGPNRVVEPMITTLNSIDEEFPLYQHSGVEFIHILSGALEYTYGGSNYTLNEGDTMQLHGEVAHGPVSVPDGPVRFISIKVYPNLTTT